MDRVNYPGLKDHMYDALYLYHGHPRKGERESNEYSTADENIRK